MDRDARGFEAYDAALKTTRVALCVASVRYPAEMAQKRELSVSVIIL
jgi:hypothetical protein